MRLREQLKSETCFLKKVVYFKYGRTVSARAIELQYQTKTAEGFRKTDETRKGPGEKSATTSAKKWSQDEDEEVQDLGVLK